MERLTFRPFKLPVAYLLEGGPGSGNWGHQGLKGVWGGSSKTGGGEGSSLLGVAFVAKRERFRRIVTNGKFRHINGTAEGINSTSKGTFSYGGESIKVCRKIITTKYGEPKSCLRIAAVADVLGTGQVPEVAIVGDEYFDNRTVIVSEWVTDKLDDWGSLSPEVRDSVSDEELEKMIVLDAITAQPDRHGGNFCLDKNNKIWLTDNDQSLEYDSALKHRLPEFWKDPKMISVFFRGTFRARGLHTRFYGTKFSPHVKGLLEKFISKEGQEHLLVSLEKIHSGSRSEVFRDAYVMRARFLLSVGEWKWEF